MNLSEIDFSNLRLENEIVKILPIKPSDFDEIYEIASDPLIWEQHPTPDRYKKEVFQLFFDGAIKSKAAYLVYDSKNKKLIGSTRFYDIDFEKNTIAIGYTFLARSHWGSTFNKSLKTLMIDFIFNAVDEVIFHVGSENWRSKKALENIGAIKFIENQPTFYYEKEVLQDVYCIKKQDWMLKT